MRSSKIKLIKAMIVANDSSVREIEYPMRRTGICRRPLRHVAKRHRRRFGFCAFAQRTPRYRNSEPSTMDASIKPARSDTLTRVEIMGDPVLDPLSPIRPESDWWTRSAMFESVSLILRAKRSLPRGFATSSGRGWRCSVCCCTR